MCGIINIINIKFTFTKQTPRTIILILKVKSILNLQISKSKLIFCELEYPKTVKYVKMNKQVYIFWEIKK